MGFESGDFAATQERKQADALGASIKATWRPSSVDLEARTAEVIFSSGADVDRLDPWTGRSYTERLRISDASVNLDRLKRGAPVLDSHKRDSVRETIGVVDDAWIENGVGVARIRFSHRAEDILQDVADGVIRNASIGYSQDAIRKQKRKDAPDLWEVTRFTPYEVSLVTVPADAAAQVRAESYSTERQVRSGDMKVEREEVRTATSIVQDAQVRERERCSYIATHCRKHQLHELERELVDAGTPLDQCKDRILEAIVNKPENNVEIDHRFAPGDDHRRSRSFVEDAAEALALRECVIKKSDNAQANEMAGWTFYEMAQRAAGIHGVSLRGLNKIDGLKRAFNTSATLPNVAATLSTRAMLGGYEAPPRTFLDAFRPSSARNFKDNQRIKLSDAPALAVVDEGDAFLEQSLSDRKESYVVKKYGHILKFTFEMAVNDDLSALTRQAELAGFSAATAESDAFWAVVTGNGNLSDTDPIFGAGTSNLTTGVALTADALEDIRETFRNMTTENSVKLNLVPRYLFVAPDLERTAEKLLRPPTNHSTSTLTDVLSNAYASQLELRVESRLPAGDYLVVADYRGADTAEYAWLDGMRGPQVAADPDFTTAGIRYRVMDVFGAGALGRHWIYNDAA